MNSRLETCSTKALLAEAFCCSLLFTKAFAALADFQLLMDAQKRMCGFAR